MPHNTRLHFDSAAASNDWRIIFFNGIELPGYFASIERLSFLGCRSTLFQQGSELHDWICSFEQIGLIMIAPRSKCIEFSEVLAEIVLSNVKSISDEIVELVEGVDSVTLFEHWIRGLRMIKESSAICNPCRWYCLCHPMDKHPLNPESMLKFKLINRNPSKTTLASFDVNVPAKPDEWTKQ